MVYSSSIRNYTIPKINTADPKKWYIEFSYQVPPPLKEFHNRPSKRFKKYGDINTVPLEERLAHAEELRREWQYNLEKLNYNPFEGRLLELEEMQREKMELNLSPEERRKLTGITDALQLFLKSKEGEVEVKTITTYRNTVNWLTEYFVKNNLQDLKVTEVTRYHISTALKEAREERGWKSNTTYNKELEFSLTIFNWLEVEEYIIKNPAKGKLVKLRTIKNKHKWYDRETAKDVKKLIKEKTGLLRACQFTYWLLIRSKKELRALKIADIDQTLKRIRFRSDLSKNKTEEFRDYPDEFQKILDEMKLENYPKSYFIFGTGGLPGTKPCSHNTFSKQWEKIRDKAGIDKAHTIYGWRHTRIVHLMMQGEDGYKISYMARHKDVKTTDFYKRDYDYSLAIIYDKEDLTF